MARVNAGLLAFNRGIISPKSLARVDLDRVRLSAERFENWLPATSGSMSIRPGTKFFGSSRNDTGATWLEFIASTKDVALLELTPEKMRIWLGDDAHNLALLERPAVDTTVSLFDTGWTDASMGGAVIGNASDLIPTMVGPTTNGVRMTASSKEAGGEAWRAGDDNNETLWQSAADVPGWLNVDFGSGNAQTVGSYTLRAHTNPIALNYQPREWRLLGSNFDTGTYAIDTGKWTLEDSRTNQTGWSVGERRVYPIPDTGTPGPWRHWRLYVTRVSTLDAIIISEFELLSDTGSVTLDTQVAFSSGMLVLNASATGSRAVAKKRVIVSDTGTEHALGIEVARGPVTLRVGSTDGDDDYIRETTLGTGHHNLAFTPQGNFHITFSSDAQAPRIISNLYIVGAGVVEIPTPWGAANLDDIRYDQSADVVYVDCAGVQPQKIERRGIGRSWSVVEYAPNNGPFLPTRSSSAKLSVSRRSPGIGLITSDVPFFTPGHVGALIRIFHQGQTGTWRLGAVNAYTDAIKMTGISDTGTPGTDSERRIIFSVTGGYSGTITIERSIDGDNIGFKPAPSTFHNSGNDTGYATDTGSFSVTIDDPDDNLVVWYRARLSSHASGVATVTATYKGGGVTGIARVLDYNSNTEVEAEVISRFSDTGGSDNWQEGYWSKARGFPTAVALHGGRLAHAQGGSLFLSVSDDFENFSDAVQGDAGPIIRTLGSGPVDSIQAMVSLLRLIIHTDGAELTLRSSSLDEPVTPTNSSAGTFSTNGSAPMRALKMDQRGIFVQRSKRKVYMVGAGSQSAFGDYEAVDLTTLVPDLLNAGVTSVAIQRQPDTRIHCVLADGTVAILTYEPQEEVVCWTTWSTDGFVEKAMVLPGVDEDAVYYHIRRHVYGLGNDAFTKILLHFDGDDRSTNITDANAGGSVHAWTVTGDSEIDTSQSKFGGGSLLVGDGNGSYVSTPDHADFALGSGDWTVDFWFRLNEGSGNLRPLCGQRTAVDPTATSFSVFKLASGVLELRVSDGTTFTDVVTTSNVDEGWHHFAGVRTGNVLKVFVDGVQEGGDVAFTGTIPDVNVDFQVGSAGAGSWPGWIDEFRLSVGVARWTSNFTPPVRPYAVPGTPITVRYLEKWALESECVGDTGLTYIMDCAKSASDTGGTTILSGFSHLTGRQVVVWANDTGAPGTNPSMPDAGKDLSPDVNGQQVTYTVDTGTGTITIDQPVRLAVAGLPYSATWKSSKLAYGAQMGTALGQQKRAPQAAVILYQTHKDGLFIGNDTGSLDPLPRVVNGAPVDPDHIFPTLDQVAFPVPGTWEPDPRHVLKAKAPRPATVLATVPTVVTSER